MSRARLDTPLAIAHRIALPRGFTLIEVLVALAIVAIGMAAVLRTLGSAADTAVYLRDKTFAEWIALNQLAQTRLNTQLPAIGTTDGELDYAGRHWRWRQDVSDGGFPGILRIDVSVQQADTPAGENAPWIATVSGALGSALAPPRLTSLYNEYVPAANPEGSSSSSSSSGSGLFGTPTTTTTTSMGPSL
ncbi:MAG TPA: type II secretion system minor pseudopilin GspI [Steroidobacteraceae bacterium]|nr:type II secretion system minor pseudopilin GspI [Steroidobacteraceae bacterium]